MVGAGPGVHTPGAGVLGLPGLRDPGRDRGGGRRLPGLRAPGLVPRRARGGDPGRDHRRLDRLLGRRTLGRRAARPAAEEADQARARRAREGDDPAARRARRVHRSLGLGAARAGARPVRHEPDALPHLPAVERDRRHHLGDRVHAARLPRRLGLAEGGALHLGGQLRAARRDRRGDRRSRRLQAPQAARAGRGDAARIHAEATPLCASAPSFPSPSGCGSASPSPASSSGISAKRASAIAPPTASRKPKTPTTP